MKRPTVKFFTIREHFYDFGSIFGKYKKTYQKVMTVDEREEKRQRDLEFYDGHKYQIIIKNTITFSKFYLSQ